MGANTNAPIILSIAAFYVIIAVIFGLIGGGLAISGSDTFTGTPDTPSGLTFLSQIGFFFAGIGVVVAQLPFWANTILFAPLGITLFYILLSFFRGSS